VGTLWGLFCKAGEQVRRHFVLTHLKRAAVGIAAGPSSVVAGRDAHVRVAELVTHVTELDTRCEELRRERVPQILW
jgi:hypothetical protein